MSYQFFAHPFRRSHQTVGPYPTREAALSAAFQAYPDAEQVTSGYGNGSPMFDIRWTYKLAWEKGRHET